MNVVVRTLSSDNTFWERTVDFCVTPQHGDVVCLGTGRYRINQRMLTPAQLRVLVYPLGGPQSREALKEQGWRLAT